MAKAAPRAAVARAKRLSKDDLCGFEELTEWIVLCVGEGHFHFPNRDEAVESAKQQAAGTPGLVVGLYRLEHYVLSQVQEPQLFDPTPKP